MRDFEYSYDVLLKVVKENVPFHLAVRSSLKQNKSDKNRDLKMVVNASSSATLRHFYVLKENIDRKYPDLDDDKILLIALAIADKLFSKRFTREEEKLLTFVRKTTGLDGIEEYINGFVDPKNLIPEDIEPESRKYFSLRCNIPLWVVRMWEKNASILCKRLYYSMRKYEKNVLRINNQKIDDESFFKKYGEYKPHSESGLAIINDIKAIKKSKAIINEEALPIFPGYKILCDDLDIDPFRGIAIFAEEKNDLLEELYIRLGTRFNADYLCGDQKTFFSVSRSSKQLCLTDLRIYECSHEAIMTCVSKPVHTFFVCPKNSNFMSLVEEPDAFLRYKQEDMDGFYDSEISSLDHACKHVEEGGDLVYFVPTFSRNEGRKVIKQFLSTHEDFTLVKERQLFPFDKYSTMLYYAIFRKEKKND